MQASQCILIFLCTFQVQTVSALRIQRDNAILSANSAIPVITESETPDEMIEEDDDVLPPVSFDQSQGADGGDPGFQELWDAESKFQMEDLSTDGNQNLCIDGHLAPEFFLIGAQKSATSAFSVMLAHPNFVHGNSLPSEPDYFAKEKHIFGNKTAMALGKEFWLSHYPECTFDKRQIAMDMTPGYIRSRTAPRDMKSFYGEQFSRVKFATVLRNPVDRIQSAFHFYASKQFDFLRCNPTVYKEGFATYTKNMMQGDDPCYLLAGSKYHTQIEHYLKVANPSQFIATFPMLEVVAPVDGISRANVAVLKAFGIQAKPANVWNINQIAHKTLAEDLTDDTDPTLLDQFQSYVDSKVDAKKVAKVHIDNNIKVYGYNGPHKEGPLADFINSRW